MHCAKEGHKLECFKENRNVFVEIDRGESLITADIPCKYGADPPFASTVPPTGSPHILISAVPSDIRNSAVNAFGRNHQTNETSGIKRVWGDPHQDKTHGATGCQTAILLNMGGSCSYLYPSV